MKLDGVDFYPGNRHSLEIHECRNKRVGPLAITISEHVLVNESFQVKTRLETGRLYEFLQRQFDHKAYGDFVQCEAQVKVWPPDEFETHSYKIQIICFPTQAKVQQLDMQMTGPPDVFIDFMCLEINYD